MERLRRRREFDPMVMSPPGAALGVASILALGAPAAPARSAELSTATEFSLQPGTDAPETKEDAPLPLEIDTPFFKAWTGSVEFGLNGSSGNSESLNLRAGVSLHRKTDELDSHAWGNYTFATDEGDKSKSRGEIGARNDWLFKDSPWLVFADALVEYDEFQSWNWRLSGHAGVGYALIKDEKTTLVGKAGAGFNQTLGGPDEAFTPEGLLGFDFTHRLTERQKIYASADYLPSMSDFPDFRLVARAGWEILIDPESKLSLKIGAEDRYDSNPGGTAKRNDLDYFALVAWSF